MAALTTDDVLPGLNPPSGRNRLSDIFDDGKKAYNLRMMYVRRYMSHIQLLTENATLLNLS